MEIALCQEERTLSLIPRRSNFVIFSRECTLKMEKMQKEAIFLIQFFLSLSPFLGKKILTL